MFKNYTVDIPVIKGLINTKPYGNAGERCVEYSFEKIYRAEKGYYSNKRTTIGKVCPENPAKMYPNENFFRFFPQIPVPEEKLSDDRSSAVRVGTSIVIGDIIENMDLKKHLSAFGEKRAGQILDFAAYQVIMEDNAAIHYEGYTYNHPLLTLDHVAYSDTTISRLFSSIGANERLAFLESYNKGRDKNERIYLSYDSSNKNYTGGAILLAEFGHPKQDIGAPIINYAVAYDCENSEPLLYEVYPGSINDVSQLGYVVDKIYEYGYRNIGIILDRGYFSKENLTQLDEKGFAFVIMVKGLSALIKEMIDANKGKFEKKRDFFIQNQMTYGMTIERKLYEDDQKCRYIHLFYDADLEYRQTRKIETKIDNMKTLMNRKKGEEVTLAGEYLKYFELTFGTGENKGRFYGYRENKKFIEDELSHCGYFAIVTSEKMTAGEALNLYRGRDASEKLFSADKTFLGGCSERVASEESLEGKMFVGFIALIIRNRIYKLLKRRCEELSGKPNYMDVPTAVDELEKIEIVRHSHGNYKMDHAITARQKTILSSFGIDAEVMEKKALNIGEELKNAKKPENKEETEDGKKADDEEPGCDDCAV